MAAQRNRLPGVPYLHCQDREVWARCPRVKRRKVRLWWAGSYAGVDCPECLALMAAALLDNVDASQERPIFPETVYALGE